MLSSVSAVAFRGQHVHVMGVKSAEQMRIIRKSNNFRCHLMFIQILVQHADHGAVQHADPAPVHGCGIGCYIRVSVMLHEIIRFSAHDSLWVSDQGCPVFTPRQAGKEIDLPVQEHLIQFAESPVNIFIIPAGIFGELPVVFIGVARLDRAFLSAFLEDLVFIVAYADLC